MTHYRYLIIGGGMTAHAAVRGIRDVDKEGPIGLIGAEPDPPYKRPPLSKGLWKKASLDSIWYDTEGLGATLHIGRTAQALDPKNSQVVDDAGDEYTYEKLLLATGGAPRRFPFGDGINYYRTVEDYRRLRDEAARGHRFAVVGGGFIGSEIAAALAMNGKDVTMIFPDEGIGARVYPADLSRSVNDYYRAKGVELASGRTVVGIERSNEGFRVRLQDEQKSGDRELTVDGVVAGLGIEPNITLAQEAGLAVENGIVVDELLRTSAADIFAAGDVASFINPILGGRLRVEHEDNAKMMGRTAGQNMAGEEKPYHHLPFFYSDLFELGYEAVGELDSRLETFSDWSETYRKGCVYYLRDGRVRGVLLWNVFGQVDAARRIIAEQGPFNAGNLKARITETKS
jgi:3-phenylpropionate/trans-cinnamate dioxygenase ferredoxin reductase subunit